MATVLISKAILKPYSSSSSCVDDEQSVNISSYEVIPLTVFDIVTHNCHIGILFVFKPPVPSNEVLKDALSKVLVHYPHLAGRFITGRTCIILNNAGVSMIETYIPATLAEQLPFDTLKDNSHLLPSVKGVGEELCQIQFNRYACDGLVLGITFHHRVADGQSIMSSFLVSWSRLVRGLDIEFVPCHDRLVVSQPRSPTEVEFDHGSIEFRKTTVNDLDTTTTPVSSSSVQTVIINYSAEFMHRLKVMVCKCNPHQSYSTFECLLSHVWKKVTEVRGLDPEESSQVRISVNGRPRISKPAVHEEYFGNLVLWAYPRLKVRELLNESYAYIANVIHYEVNRVDNRYFRSFIDFGAAIDQEGGESNKTEELQQTTPGFGSTLCPNLEVDSWLRFRFHDIDFGGGSPCGVIPPNSPFEGLVVFIPAGTEDGGVDVKLTLFAEHVPLFKKIAHSIDPAKMV